MYKACVYTAMCTLQCYTIHMFIDTYNQWRSEGGRGGGQLPRAQPGGGRQNPAKEFKNLYWEILKNLKEYNENVVITF